MKRIIWAAVIIILPFCLPPNVMAIREFKKGFLDHYAALCDDPDVKSTFRKANCNLCHLKGEKKDLNNPYGDQIAKLMQGDSAARLKEAKKNGTKKETLDAILAELNAALDKVESLQSPDGGTFGERIRAGKTPVEIPQTSDDADDADEADEADEEPDASASAKPCAPAGE